MGESSLRPLRQGGRGCSPYRPWRILLGLALSLLWPGLGHLATGLRGRGALFAALPLTLLPFSARLSLLSPAALLGLAVQPRLLLLATVVNLGLALYRTLVLLDLWRVLVASGGRARLRGVLRRALVLSLLLGALLAPHALVGYAVARWYAFLDKTFTTAAPRSPDTGLSVTVPVPATPPVAWLPVPSATPSLDVVASPPWEDVQESIPPSPVPARPTPAPSATPTPEVPPTPVTDPLAPALADGRLVVLLIGTDAGPGRWSARADTIIVVAYDARSQRAAVVGVPRNVTRIPVPAELDARYPSGVWPDLANALYTYGLRNPELFPGAVDPGAAALAGSLERLLGLTIDYTVAVDMGGFVRLVDALGGVTIDVPRPVATWLSPPFPGEDWRYYQIPVGRQHLDGHAALAYVRSRTGTSDYDRMQRQRCLLAALYRQTDVPTVLVRLPGILDAIHGAVRTDIPLEALPGLVQLAASVQPDQVSALGLTPPEYAAGWAPGGYPIPDAERIRGDLEALLSGSDPEAATRLALPSACRWQPCDPSAARLPSADDAHREQTPNAEGERETERRDPSVRTVRLTRRRHELRTRRRRRDWTRRRRCRRRRHGRLHGGRRSDCRTRLW